MKSDLKAHIRELRDSRETENTVAWHLKAMTRVVLRAFSDDLDYVHDLGMSEADQRLVTSQLAVAITHLAAHLQSNETKRFLEYLDHISKHFTGWYEFSREGNQLGYWNLKRLYYYQKRLSRLSIKNGSVAQKMRIEDLETAFQAFLELAVQSPATFYQLRLIFDSLSELSDVPALTGLRQASLPITKVVSASVPLFFLLKRDLDAIYRLSPAAFEEFVAESLDQAGMDVRQVSTTFRSDGGVDLIATPRDSSFPFLLAVQVKHHRQEHIKTGPGPVKDMQSVLTSLPFHAGMIVTNTEFTPDAFWWASQSPGKLQLHDISSIRQWIQGKYDATRLKNIPRKIQLTPRLHVDIW